MDTAAATSSVAELFDRGVLTPIADLCPQLPDQQSRLVRGEITILWPYSAFRQSFAFVIAEPDVLLRDSKGQIRVQISGPSAKAVAESRLESGDEVLLSLRGAEWSENTYDARIPGSCSDWELRYPQGIALQVKPAFSDGTTTLDLTGTPPENPSNATQAPAIELDPADAAAILHETVASSPDLKANNKSVDGEFASPAFIKRARLSYGGLFELDHDPFAQEDDGGSKENGRKRARFGRYSSSWRYASRSPSPVPSEADAAADAAVETTAPPPAIIEPTEAALQSSPAKPPVSDNICQVVETDPGILPLDPGEEEPPAFGDATVEPTAQTELSIPAPPAQPLELPEQDVAKPPQSPAFGSGTLFGRFTSSTGDYSVPRFQMDAAVYESGPSIEEQVRFGFHHSPASPLAPHGAEIELPDPASQVQTTTDQSGSEQLQHSLDLPMDCLQGVPKPQVLPLWSVSNDHILDPDHADAELPIDPALTAAMGLDEDVDQQVQPRSALPTETDLYGTYNERRYQNEAEEEMVAENMDGTAGPSSEDSMDETNAEYERELANEAYDDYDMRNYADVDDDVEESYEAGGAAILEDDDEAEYYSDESNNQSGDEGEDEDEDEDEELSEEDDDESDNSQHAALRKPLVPMKNAGPVVIDLLSDSSDDEGGSPGPTSSPRSAENQPQSPDGEEAEQEARPIETSPQSAALDEAEAHSSPSSQADSEDERDCEVDAEQSDEDAAGEDDEFEGFESPVRSIVQSAPQTPRRTVAALQEGEKSKAGGVEEEDTVPLMSGALFPTEADEMHKSIEVSDANPENLSSSALENDERTEEKKDGEAQEAPLPNQEDDSAMKPTTLNIACGSDEPSSRAGVDNPMTDASYQHPNAPKAQSESPDRLEEQKARESANVPDNQDDIEMEEAPPPLHGLSSPKTRPPLHGMDVLAATAAEHAAVQTSVNMTEDEPASTEHDQRETVVSIDMQQAVSVQAKLAEPIDTAHDDAAAILATVKVVEKAHSSLEIVEDTAAQPVPHGSLESSPQADDHVPERPGSSLATGPSQEFATQVPMSDIGSIDNGLATDSQEDPATDLPNAVAYDTQDSIGRRFASQEPASGDVDMADAASISDNESEADQDRPGQESASKTVDAPGDIKDAASPASDGDDSVAAMSEVHVGIEQERRSSPVDEMDASDAGQENPATIETSGYESDASGLDDDGAQGQLVEATLVSSERESIRGDGQDNTMADDFDRSSPFQNIDSSPREDPAAHIKSPELLGSHHTQEAEDSIGAKDGDQAGATNNDDDAEGTNETAPAKDRLEVSGEVGQVGGVNSGEGSSETLHNVEEDAAAAKDATETSPRGKRSTRKAETGKTAASVATKPVTRAARTKQASANTDTAEKDPSIWLARGAVGKTKKAGAEKTLESSANSEADPGARLARASAGAKRKQGAAGQDPATTSIAEGDPSARLARGSAGNKRKPATDQRAALADGPDADPSIRLARGSNGGNKRKRLVEQLDVPGPAPKTRMTTRSASSSLRRSASPGGIGAEDAQGDEAAGAVGPRSPSQRQKPAAGGDLDKAAGGDLDKAPPSALTNQRVRNEIARRLREDLPDYASLIRLGKLVGRTVDALGVATTAGTEPKRTKARQYCMSFNVTDASVSSRVHEVELYRLHKESLPVVKAGDRVVLRGFKVVALTDRGWGLRSVEASTYAVFDDVEDANSEGDGMAQVRGPPVELSPADYDVAGLLKQWWDSLDDGVRDKLDKQNKKLAVGGAAAS